MAASSFDVASSSSIVYLPQRFGMAEISIDLAGAVRLGCDGASSARFAASAASAASAVVAVSACFDSGGDVQLDSPL